MSIFNDPTFSLQYKVRRGNDRDYAINNLSLTEKNSFIRRAQLTDKWTLWTSRVIDHDTLAVDRPKMHYRM